MLIFYRFFTYFLLEIVHNDIKPANILLTSKSFKLGDFGFCMIVQEGQT